MGINVLVRINKILNEILKMKNLNQGNKIENCYRADYYRWHLQLKSKVEWEKDFYT